MDVSGLMHLLVFIVVGGLIYCGCTGWFIGYVGLPEPFNKVARVILGLVALIFLISLLLNMGGVSFADIHRLW